MSWMKSLARSSTSYTQVSSGTAGAFGISGRDQGSAQTEDLDPAESRTEYNTRSTDYPKRTALRQLSTCHTSNARPTSRLASSLHSCWSGRLETSCTADFSTSALPLALFCDVLMQCADDQ